MDDNVLPGSLKVKTEVPQGSILGLLLLSIYTVVEGFRLGDELEKIMQYTPAITISFELILTNQRYIGNAFLFR